MVETSKSGKKSCKRVESSDGFELSGKFTVTFGLPFTILCVVNEFNRKSVYDNYAFIATSRSCFYNNNFRNYVSTDTVQFRMSEKLKRKLKSRTKFSDHEMPLLGHKRPGLPTDSVP